jgi:membrane-associated phospholipid phosphatase
MRLVDWLVSGYGATILLLTLGRPELSGQANLIVAHLLVAVLPWLANRAGDSAAATALRAAYPVVLLPALYSSIDLLNAFGQAPTHDSTLLAIEEAVFGMQPARDWWRTYPSHFWSTLLHAVYLSYYIIVPLPIVVFLARRDRAAIDHYLAVVISTFILCYLCYVLWPVAGPYYVFDRPTGEFVANLPARWVYAGLSSGSAFGAAFPSSHVAATVAAAGAAWQFAPRLGAWLAVPTVLLAVGVVYCQMHYVIDSVLGVALALSVLFALRPATLPAHFPTQQSGS